MQRLKRKSAALNVMQNRVSKKLRSLGLQPRAGAFARHPPAILRSGPATAPGKPRKVWLKYCISINCTTGAPGFQNYTFKANDPYRPDGVNNVNPNGWTQYGGIYNYAHVIGARLSVKSWMYDANNACVNSICWGDANFSPALGTATASGYSFPYFNVSNGIGPKYTGNSSTHYVTFRTPFIKTKDILKEVDETQDATTVAGGGAASPASLWYFNLITQPVVSAANKNILLVTLEQLVEFYDSTGL